MDTIQLIIAIIYLLTSIKSELESALMIIFLINLILNILELLKLWCCGGKDQTNSNVKGGYYQMFFGFLIGILAVIIFLIDTAVRYKDELQEEATWRVILYLTMIGEIICLLFALVLPCGNILTWSNETHKKVLGFLYGLSVGLFSVFYGFLTSVCLILYAITYCWTKLDSSNEVHPQNDQ